MKHVKFILVYSKLIKFNSLFFSVYLGLIFNVNAQTTFQKTFLQNSPIGQIDESVSQLIIDNNLDIIIAVNSKELFSQLNTAAIYKTDFNGSLTWLKYYYYYNTSNYISSLLLLPDGNYLAAGNLFDSTGQNASSFILKLDSAGSIIWSKLIPFSNRGILINRLFVSGDNIYCGGLINNFSLGSLKDFAIFKINDEGNVLWSKYLSNINDNDLYDIVTTQDSGCAFIGYTQISNIPIDSDIYYGKVSSSGVRQWTKQITLADAEGYNVMIKESLDGGLIICSYVRNTGFGNGDILLIKTDVNGNIFWSKLIGSANMDYPTSIEIFINGDILISGSVADSAYNVRAMNIQLDSAGNIRSGLSYGMNYGGRFSASTQKNGVNVFSGEFNYFPPFGLWELYLVKADSHNITGCYENSYSISDSSITLTSQNISDSLIDELISLTDIVMNVSDVSLNVVDSVFCLINAIPDVSSYNDFIIFPNPNNGNFNLLVQESINGKCLIYDLNGKIVFENDFVGGTTKFYLNDLLSGIYFLRLISESGKNYNRKFILQH